jgi:hypothetical protein
VVLSSPVNSTNLHAKSLGYHVPIGINFLICDIVDVEGPSKLVMIEGSLNRPAFMLLYMLSQHCAKMVLKCLHTRTKYMSNEIEKSLYLGKVKTTTLTRC